MTTGENLAPTPSLGELSSSPRSSILLDSYLLLHDREEKPGPSCDDNELPAVRLDEFIESIPSLVERYKALPRCDDGTGPLGKPIQDLLGRVELPRAEWERYAVLDPSKSYTRNLVATDHCTYTLLLLVWTPGKASPIHDHPCDGCWMRVLSGSIRECRYAPRRQASPSQPRDGDSSAVLLECVQDDVYEEGQVLHIEDCLGYHKVENPSPTQPAVTLHLYSPPFDRCRVWLDETGASSRSSRVRYDSEYGIPS